MRGEIAFSEPVDDLHRIIWQSDDSKVTVDVPAPACPDETVVSSGQSKSCHMYVIFETYSAFIPTNPVKGSR